MKPDYEKIKEHCLTNSAISKLVIDENLMYYAAERENVLQEIDANLKKYRQVVRELPEYAINYFKSMMIVYRIFRQEGYIDKYLKRPEIQSLPADQVEFLDWQATHPWMFSFASIIDEPAPDFYLMVDEINEIEYLVYSPGMTRTLEDMGGIAPRLWFNLIADNGLCFQTFGSIIACKGFTWDDLYFFASSLNPSLVDARDFWKTVDRNPFPFLMLISGANKPIVTAKEHEVFSILSSDQVSSFPLERLDAQFTTNSKKGIYELGLKGFVQFPHFAIAYYNENKKELVRTASTEIGFASLSDALIRAGIEVEPEADIVVTPSMLSTTEHILGRKLVLNPYSDLFNAKDHAEEENGNLDAINRFIGLMMDCHNAKIQPDIEKLAAEAQIDIKTAESIWKQMVDTMEKMMKDKGN